MLDSPIVNWAIITRLRTLNRSAIAPPHRPKISRGANCSELAIPTVATLWVNCSSSQSCAMRATQKPVPPNSMAMR